MKDKKPMTKWEAGNVLADAADKLSECAADLEGGGFVTEAIVLKYLRKKIAFHFSKNGYVKEMGFGL